MHRFTDRPALEDGLLAGLAGAFAVARLAIDGGRSGPTAEPTSSQVAESLPPSSPTVGGGEGRPTAATRQ